MELIRNKGSSVRGKLKSWSNASGHYIPPPSLASQAGLPMDLFVPIEAP